MVNVKLFTKRLNEFADENNLVPKELAKALKQNEKCIYNWLSGKSKFLPTIENIINIADYFNCSVDYLVGVSDDDSKAKTKSDAMDFPKKFMLTVKEFDYNLYSLAREANISNTSVFYDWKNGKTSPRIDTLATVCKTLGCTIDYILERD